MFSMLFTVSETQLPTGTTLPCSVLILSMAKNQSDVENLVENCLNSVIIYLEHACLVDCQSQLWILEAIDRLVTSHVRNLS